jgi:hypothetical protein
MTSQFDNYKHPWPEESLPTGDTDTAGNLAYAPGVIVPNGFVSIVATLTRPNDTTAYAQYDLIADSTSAAAATEFQNAVRQNGQVFRAEKFRLRCSDPLILGKTIRAHCWHTAPTLTVNDNGVFNASGAGNLAVSDVVGYVGFFDVTFDSAGTAGAVGRGIPSEGSAMFFKPASGTSVYATYELRTAAGYTPVAQATFHGTFSGEWS